MSIMGVTHFVLSGLNILAASPLAVLSWIHKTWSSLPENKKIIKLIFHTWNIKQNKNLDYNPSSPAIPTTLQDALSQWYPPLPGVGALYLALANALIYFIHLVLCLPVFSYNFWVATMLLWLFICSQFYTYDLTKSISYY